MKSKQKKTRRGCASSRSAGTVTGCRLDPAIQKELADILRVCEEASIGSWEMEPDGSDTRPELREGTARLDAQRFFAGP